MDQSNFDRGVEERLGLTDDNGLRAIQIALSFTCYFREGHSADVRKRVSNCIRDYLSLAGSEVKWAKHPDTMAWLPVASPSLPPAEPYLASLDEDRAWELAYHGGDDSNAASDFLLEAFGSAGWKRRMSYFRTAVPITWFADHEGSWLERVAGWCDEIQPVHGYGGLGIIQSPNGTVMNRHEPDVYAIARRFCGLEFDDPVLHLPYVENGIKGVNWLTVIDREFVEKAGGLVALRQDLGAGVKVLEYRKGAIIQAGDRPRLADRNRDQFPELYARVARLLQPIRITEHRAFQHAGPGRFTRETSEEWLRRFDG